MSASIHVTAHSSGQRHTGGLDDPNLTASANQIQAVIDNGLIPHVIDIIAKGDFESKKEAVLAIVNLTFGTSEQIAYCVQCGAIGPMCEMLTVTEAEVITHFLYAIGNILQSAEQCGEAESICLMIKEAGRLDTLEQHLNGPYSQTKFLM